MSGAPEVVDRITTAIESGRRWRPISWSVWCGPGKKGTPDASFHARLFTLDDAFGPFVLEPLPMPQNAEATVAEDIQYALGMMEAVCGAEALPEGGGLRECIFAFKNWVYDRFAEKDRAREEAEGELAAMKGTSAPAPRRPRRWDGHTGAAGYSAEFYSHGYCGGFCIDDKSRRASALEILICVCGHEQYGEGDMGHYSFAVAPYGGCKHLGCGCQRFLPSETA